MDATDTKQVGKTKLASVFLTTAFCRRPNDRFVKMGDFSKPGHSFYINRVYQRGLLAMASLFIRWEQSQIQAVVGLFLLTQLPRYKSGLVACCVILHLGIPDLMTQLLLGQHLLGGSQSL